jgi:hypothetical protein
MTVWSEGVEKDRIVLSNVIAFLKACKGQDEVLVDGHQGPVTCKKCERGIDPFEVCPNVSEDTSHVNTQHFSDVGSGVVKYNGVVSATEGVGGTRADGLRFRLWGRSVGSCGGGEGHNLCEGGNGARVWDR